MKRRIISTICVMCLGLSLLVSCSKEKKEDVAEEKIDFQKSTVFAVNGEEVSEGEWNLYAIPILDETNVIYGKDIWSYKMDPEGRLFGESLQESIRERIVNVKVVAGQAASLGVKLTEDEKNEISISASEYLDKLSETEKNEYGITEELVEKVYSDNLLATKVYENLTLNVDTSTEETEVRHMVLNYIMQPKTYEDKEGNTCFYEDSEIAANRTGLESIREKASASKEIHIKDFETEKYVVTEIITDLNGLKERLPEDMAGIVFWLRQGEVSRVLESDEAIFLFECVELEDEASTRDARIKIIEQREKEVFSDAFEKWKENVNVVNNPTVWKSITDRINAYGS